MIFRAVSALCVSLSLAACGAEPVWAPEEDVARAIYRHEAQPSLTLITVVNKRSGQGAHTALLINASQRVIWDPAGTWWNPAAPERNDLHYGMTPRMLDIYIDYHSRASYDTIVQEIPVSAEVAQLAFREAAAYGAVPKASCTISTARILARLPGFADIPQVLFPGRLSEALATRPGVVTKTFQDDDADDNSGLLPQG